MKGIKKIILRNADILNDQQMKSIFGGSGSSSGTSGSQCAASCGHCSNVSPCNPNAEVFAAATCNYKCTASDGSGVRCTDSSGKETLSMSCEKARDRQCYCEQDV
jgi:natural product precursor